MAWGLVLENIFLCYNKNLKMSKTDLVFSSDHMIDNMAAGCISPTVAEPTFTDITVYKGRGIMHTTVGTAVGG